MRHEWMLGWMMVVSFLALVDDSLAALIVLSMSILIIISS